MWNEVPEAELDQLHAQGVDRRYADGARLPGADEGFDGIRRILKGQVEVWADGLDRPITVCAEGEFIGVRSFLFPEASPRLSWRARGDVACREFAGAPLRKLMRRSRPLSEVLMLEARRRLMGAVIAAHPVFSLLEREARKHLFDKAEVRILQGDMPLIVQRQERPDLYLIVSGRVRVMRDGRFICHRSVGDIVGEISVFGFSESPIADVIADTWTEVVVFPRSDILDAARHHPDFRKALVTLCQKRIVNRDRE